MRWGLPTGLSYAEVTGGHKEDLVGQGRSELIGAVQEGAGCYTVHQGVFLGKKKKKLGQGRTFLIFSLFYDGRINSVLAQ